jgi:serine protease Do
MHIKYLIFLASFCLIMLQPTSAEGNPPLQVNVDARAMEAGSEQVVSYADVLERATPSVVAVYTSRIVAARETQQISDILRQFGYRVPPSLQQGAPRERKERLGVGSGVIISENGYIVTNHHVVQGMRGRMADEIRVRLNDSSEYVAEFIGSDPKTDVAVLKIAASIDLPAVQLADSEQLRVGDVVFAIGNPLDVGLTATQGIVSATVYWDRVPTKISFRQMPPSTWATRVVR